MIKLNKNSLLDFLIFLFPLTIYLVSCAPGIGFGDTAIIIDNIYNFKVNSQVNSHPLSVFIGQPFMWLPIDNIAYKANLMSVFAGSISVFLLYKALFYVFESRLVPILTAGIFTFNKAMWWHSTVVENYAISSVLTGFALIAFVKFWKTDNSKWLQYLFFIVGLGIYNHVQFGFLGMGVGVAFLMQIRKESAPLAFFMRCSLAITAGLIPWLITIFYDYSLSGDFFLTLKMAFVGVFADTFFSVSFVQGLRDTGFVYLLEYPHIFLPLPFIGIYFAAKKMGSGSASFWGIFTYLIANSVFFTYYNTWDRFAFLLQSFMVLTFFGAFSIAAFFDYLDSKDQKHIKNLSTLVLIACMLWSALFYSLMTQWGKTPDSMWHKNWNNNYSNNLYEHSEFTINPNKYGYRELDVFAERLFTLLPENAIYIDDDSRTYYPLVDYFQKLYQRRLDINMLLINSWSIEGWGNSPADIARVIKRAHARNRPLYMASLKWPYNLILARLPSHIRFVKFPIGGGRWIYKLVLRDENATRIDFSKQDKVNYIDIETPHVIPNNSTFYTAQDMTSFKGKWQFDDHIFVNIPTTTSHAKFTLRSEFAGQIDLTLHLTQSPDFGIFTVFLNEQVIVEHLDLRNDYTRIFHYSISNKVDIKKGENTLSFRPIENDINNKNIKLGIDGLSFQQ